jgi:hypothetical protein
MRGSLVFLRELVVANVRVAWEVVTPGFTMQAGDRAGPDPTADPWEA